MSFPDFDYLAAAEESLQCVDFPAIEQPQINYAAACALVAIAQELRKIAAAVSPLASGEAAINIYEVKDGEL